MIDVYKKNKKGDGSYLGEGLSKKVSLKAKKSIFESKEVRHVNSLGEVEEPGILGRVNSKCKAPE